MARKSARVWFLVPLLVLACAFACAPAAFASEVHDLQTIQLQDENLFGTVGPDIEKAVITFDNDQQVYTGGEIHPSFKVTLNGKELTKGSESIEDEPVDFYYVYSNEIDVSVGQTDNTLKPQVTLIAFAKKNDEVNAYFKTDYFNIVPADIGTAVATATNEVYSGKKITPETVVTYNGKTLQKGVDYDVAYVQKVKKKATKKSKAKKVWKKVKPKNVGTYYVRITGKGNFTGTKYVKFKIKKASISNAKFTNVKDRVYTGNKISPKVTVKFAGKKLKQGRDYKIKYSNNLNVGVATITITGKGNLKGKQQIKFAIKPCPINTVNATFNRVQPYTGWYVTPDPKYKFNGDFLQPGVDFTTDYFNNRDKKANAKIRVYGRGNFTGSDTLYFKIDTIPMSQVTIVPIPDQKHTGYPIKPSVTVKYDDRVLRQGIDYTVVAYNYNTEATVNQGRKAEILLQGDGDSFSGYTSAYFTIVK